MGTSNSKPSNDEALLLCKDRTQFIKQAIDFRYALSAAHLSYIQSLRTVGAALRRFAESELPAESSLSASEFDKSPSHSLCASPSPPRGGSPSFLPDSNTNYMRAAASSSVTVTIDPATTVDFTDQESLSFLPPPPPPPGFGSSWDFFDPAQNGDTGLSLNFARLKGLRQFREAEVVPFIEEEQARNSHESDEDLNICKQDGNDKQSNSGCRAINGSVEDFARMEIAREGQELCAEREDASEFITHRAKDFLSSMKDIEHRFFRAAEAGNEVSRMLETNKIRIKVCSDAPGGKPPSTFLSTFHGVCCKGKTLHKHDSTQPASNVIWNLSVSSLSSSSPSKNPITSVEQDDGAKSSSDFVVQFSMISGSHSSTLERLYAWERKLHDEVKASESVRRAYDNKCRLLRQQFARDVNPQLIDKTRAAVKDLHSRVCIMIEAVDSISKRIEKMRDDELQPQLSELIQGLIRMWKAMLECHHAQFITISLAYYAKTSVAAPPQCERHRQATTQLITEIDGFSSSFANWVNAHISYVENLNSWLQKCVLQPQDHRRGRRRATIFPPRQALSPPIFVLCREWLAGLKSLPIEELLDSINGMGSVLRESLKQHVEEEKARKDLEALDGNSHGEFRDMTCLETLQPSLRTVFDQLTKFSEGSLKLCGEVKQGNEMARAAYKIVEGSNNVK